MSSMNLELWKVGIIFVPACCRFSAFPPPTMGSINSALEESVPPSPCQVHVSPQQQKQPDALHSALEPPLSSPPASPDGFELPSPDLQGPRSTAGEGLLVSQVDASPEILPGLKGPAAESACNAEREPARESTAAFSPVRQAARERQHHRQTAAASSRPSPIMGSAAQPGASVQQSRPSEQHPAAIDISLRKQPRLNMAIAPAAAASPSPGTHIARDQVASTEGSPAQSARSLPGLQSPHPDQYRSPMDPAISPELHSQMPLPVADTPAADESGPLDDDIISPSWQPSTEREGIAKAASKQASARPGSEDDHSDDDQDTSSADGYDLTCSLTEPPARKAASRQRQQYKPASRRRSSLGQMKSAGLQHKRACSSPEAVQQVRPPQAAKPRPMKRLRKAAHHQTRQPAVPDPPLDGACEASGKSHMQPGAAASP